MSTTIISKEQAKFARYLANKAFEKKGTAKKVDGKKERTYITPGCCLIWTEVPVTEGVEIEVLKAVWGDKEYSGGMLVYDSHHMDFMAALSILGGNKTEEAKPHQDVVDAVAMAVEYLAQGPADEHGLALPLNPDYPRETPAKDVSTVDCELSASADPDADNVIMDTPSDAQATQAHIAPAPDPKPVMSLHAKYTACATMRLAHDLGYALDTPLKEIVEKEGTTAVLRYQEILRKVPSYGLTEARLKFAFPVEYANL